VGEEIDGVYLEKILFTFLDISLAHVRKYSINECFGVIYMSIGNVNNRQTIRGLCCRNMDFEKRLKTTATSWKLLK